MKDPLHTFAQKVSLAPSRAVRVLIRIELSQVSLGGFQKFFLFWIAWMILEAWNVELESVLSFVFQFCF